MKRGIVGGLGALLIAAGLIASAPPAGAGCLYGGPVLSKCDGPVQPDGTWQRCVAVARLIPNGASSYLVPDGHCDVMGPDHPPADFSFADPPTHIDG
ncbi:hypothetical protein HMPREF0591_3999 [Mycobacterium parascrofulaceum ATCC BAA-614]|jgi:hypothetical protein|uniref:CDGP domain-containing protein n=1 Tax=Mycobacterium parascrofulaceum ATCC BAA-614 TaxID=525368 RepID=D5PCV5_9MYCO|nr:MULTISPECIES: hypothetical protein [Mycobacterium]EFG76104.1 hypothetical protein HMPREF0591_3999 [Mycobacterium parascrofulaceum ATCC BAA-614]OCB62740.1 hypothetical protein A9X02_05360 [Mycobacterium malmoense]